MTEREIADEAERLIFPMPTIEQVVAAGYAPEEHTKIKQRRDELIGRFKTDSLFRAGVLAEQLKRQEMDADSRRRESAERAVAWRRDSAQRQAERKARKDERSK